MLFYNVAENGALRKTKKVDFSDDNRVYIFDDNDLIYLWQGKKASKKKKELSIKKANLLNKQRKNSAKIQILQQDHEFGGFLVIMNDIKEGKIKNLSIERRPELQLELEAEDTKELIAAGLEPDLVAEINLAAFDLAQQNKDYEDLCRQLAILHLSIIKGKKNASEKEIKEKAKEIFNSSSTYEEVCWLISELKILAAKDYFKKNQ